MKPKNPEAFVIAAGLIFVWCLLAIARWLLLPLLCLILVLLGWRPASSHTPLRIEPEAPVASLPSVLATASQRPALADLKVSELRRMAPRTMPLALILPPNYSPEAPAPALTAGSDDLALFRSAT